MILVEFPEDLAWEAKPASYRVFGRPEDSSCGGSFQNINHDCFHEINNRKEDEDEVKTIT